MATRRTVRNRRVKRYTVCPRGMQVQSVVLDRSLFNQRQAQAWLRRHGFRTDLDLKTNTMRARQAQPSQFVRTSFRTIHFKPGVLAVVGCPLM